MADLPALSFGLIPQCRPCLSWTAPSRPGNPPRPSVPDHVFSQGLFKLFVCVKENKILWNYYCCLSYCIWVWTSPVTVPGSWSSTCTNLFKPFIEKVVQPSPIYTRPLCVKAFFSGWESNCGEPLQKQPTHLCVNMMKFYQCEEERLENAKGWPHCEYVDWKIDDAEQSTGMMKRKKEVCPKNWADRMW